jgi:signal peptide peptidase SppA
MRFIHVLEVLYNEPWCITESAHAKIRAVVHAKLNGSVLDIPEESSKQEMLVKRTVAIIPIHGVLAKRVSSIEKSSGVTDVGDIANNLAEAIDDDSVSSVMLDVDSPGGSAKGIAGLAENIKAANSIKPVFAYCDGLMCSGALWLAAGAGHIMASSDSEIGSVGCYIPFLDQSLAFEKEGLTMDVIKNEDSPYKGMGVEGTSLTKEQRAHLVQRVTDISDSFKSHLISNRPNISSESMDGRSFNAKDSLSLGLIDEIGTFEDALKSCAMMAALS